MIAAGELAVSISPDSIPWIEFTDAGTDLGRVISSSVEALPLVDRILLVSDGCHNIGPDPIHIIGTLGREVSCLFVDAEGEQADLTILALQAPSLVLPDQKLAVHVRVGQMGGSCGVSTTARLTVGGREMDTKDVVLHPDGIADVELSCELTEAGATTGRVRIDPVRGEKLESNNTRDFPVEVRKSKWLCGILFSKPSWDLTFLRRSLMRDGGFDVVVEVPGLELESKRRDREEIDILVVGLYGAGEPASWRRRAGEVVDRGGALVILGWPSETTWGELSPLTCSAAPNEERRIELREGASTHPLATFLESGSIEKQFPPLTLPSGEITPSSRAAVILETADGRPSLAVHPVSGGYALAWVGSDWWRRSFSTDPDQGKGGFSFWPAALRWLLSPGDRGRLRVHTPSRNIIAGEQIIIGVEVFDRGWEPATQGRVEIDLKHSSAGSTIRRRATIHGGESGVIALDLSGLGPGEWSVQASAFLGQGDTLRTSTRLVVSEASAEMIFTEPDSALLARIARQTGGTLIKPSEVARIESLRSSPKPSLVRRRVRFRTTPFSFLILLSLLGTEWWLRQRRGLP